MTAPRDSTVKFSYQIVPVRKATGNTMAIVNQMGAQGWRWMRPPVKEDHSTDDTGTVMLFFEKACQSAV
jgi:hypothetical protein